MYVVFLRSEYYDTSDFRLGFLESLIFSLVPQYSVRLRPNWISHVHPCTFIACHALRPRGGYLTLPFCGLDNVAFWLYETMGHTRLYSFRSSITSACAYGLQCLLPTLNLLHYYSMPKAGYEMCWVSTFSTALSAVSTMALSWRTHS